MKLFRWCCIIGALLFTSIGCGVSRDQYEQVQNRLELTEQKLAIAQQVFVLNTNVLTIPPAAAQRGYTLINETNRMTLLWHGAPVWQTTNTDYAVSVSPDGRAAVWRLECFPFNYRTPIEERAERYYLLWSARDGNKPVLLPSPRQSRGEDTDQSAMLQPPLRSPKAKLVIDNPENLWFCCGDFHWDSTSAFLYFSSGFGYISSGWWQLKPGTCDVRFVDYGGQCWLLPQPKGADQVLIQGLRYEGPPDTVKNYSNCYLYTPEDIAKPIFKESHVRKKPSPTWGND